MSCGTRGFFGFVLAFSFIAVTWPKMANRLKKQPAETRIYRKFFRFMEHSKTKTVSSICWLSARAHKCFSSFLIVSLDFHFQSRHQFKKSKQL